MRASSLLLSLLALAFVLGACEESLGPDLGPIADEPSTATLFSFNTSAIREPSAFNAIGGSVVRTDQSSSWDLLLAGADGGLEFRPRSLVLRVDASSGLQPVEASFEGLETAPDSGYVTDEPVPLAEGGVYAVRSRQDPNIGVRCVRYLKLEVLAVGPDLSSVDLRFLGNPNCGRRTLVAGAGGDEQGG